ncbi:MAG: hypothetical protein IKM63_04655 [Firmicutes bacterium]|nr:hypothetical protein [Bacillota bacterium]MBR6799344.1 hypothetical protein [Bacillota bacterium]
MKNKIVTLLCILAILITTAIVALAGTDEPRYDIDALANGDISIDMQMNGKSSFSEFNDSYIYPMIGEITTTHVTVPEGAAQPEYYYDFANNGNVLNKMVTVKNNGEPVYVRIVFAFEAGGFNSLQSFHDAFYININSSDWTWPDNGEWREVILDDGNKYFMTAAVYEKPLAPGAATSPSLIQIGLHYRADNSSVERYDDGKYRLYAVAQPIPVSAINNSDMAVISNAFNEQFNNMTQGTLPSQWESTNN